MSALEHLESELGAAMFERHAPLCIDGVELCATLRPENGDALARALATLGRHGLSALPRGGGTNAELGNPPARADTMLSMQAFSEIDEFDAAEGVCHAGSGTPLAQLRETVCAGGWELPFDVPNATATLGGALATAAIGPRAHGYGLPRDVVLGLEVALASGDRTHCGGRVVKNVTGYDLAKLYVGSLGSLGVIEGAWVRLRPKPESVRVLEISFAACDSVVERAVEISRRSSVRACALVSDATGALCCTVECAGDASIVAQDEKWLVDAFGAESAPRDALLDIHRAQRSTPAPQGVRFRLAALPSKLPSCIAGLARAGARIVAYPGLNLVYAGFSIGSSQDREALDRVFRVMSEIRSDARGEIVCESAPPCAKRERDVFSVSPDALSLMRALKTRFDPRGVLNPGRFAGGL